MYESSNPFLTSEIEYRNNRIKSGIVRKLDHHSAVAFRRR